MSGGNDQGLAAAGLGWQVGDNEIVAGINAQITPHAVTGIVGPNGSGKTTLLHLLAGLRKPTAGSVTLRGRDVSRMQPRQRARHIALMEQHGTTDLELTAREVVELGRLSHAPRTPLRPHGSRHRGKGHDNDAVQWAMLRAGASDLAPRSWSTLSGGERQRVHLARTLAQESDILLLDEPTNHLDLNHQIAFLAQLRELGHTCVVVLHDLDLAAAMCDEVMVMAGGQLIVHAPTDQALQEPRLADVFGVRTSVIVGESVRVRWRGLVDGKTYE